MDPKPNLIRAFADGLEKDGDGNDATTKDTKEVLYQCAARIEELEQETITNRLKSK